MKSEIDYFANFPAPPALPQTEGVNGEEKEETANCLVVSDLSSEDSGGRESEGAAGTEGGPQCEESQKKAPQYYYTFSDKIPEEAWPPLFRDVSLTQADVEMKDCMVLGSMTILSGAMPNFFGVYGQHKVYAPFYTIVNAPAASNKGSLTACRYLLEPIEKEIRQRNQQEQEENRRQLAEYMALDAATRRATTTPNEPPYRSLWIPANTTVSACYQALNDNNEWGVTFETEADTLSTVLQSEYGNYSDLLRKAFHHEPCSLRRRKDNEFIMVNEPRWAVLLTCTPGQIPALLPTAENGLGSRFLFYSLKRNLVWRNMFERNERTLEDLFLGYGNRYKSIYDELTARNEDPIEFRLSIEQQTLFNNFFNELQVEQVGLHGDDLIAFVRRLGLVCFRMALVLTVVRHEGRHPIIDPLSRSMVCLDVDFKIAMAIVNALINHTGYVYTNLMGHENEVVRANVKASPQEKQFYEQLPSTFLTAEARDIATRLGIPWRTAERYLGNYVSKYHLIDRVGIGHYQKRQT